MLRSYLKKFQDLFLPEPFQFIIHYAAEKASLHNQESIPSNKFSSSSSSLLRTIRTSSSPITTRLFKWMTTKVKKKKKKKPVVCIHLSRAIIHSFCCIVWFHSIPSDRWRGRTGKYRNSSTYTPSHFSGQTS
jgi:hypothetical protein